jgi:hypothetical protein
MGWETRRGNRYYYRKRREGRRVVSTYVGVGAFAEALAGCEHADRLAQQRVRESVRQERAVLEACEQPLADLADLLRVLTDATLVTNGYHQHKRQWRRRREQAD